MNQNISAQYSTQTKSKANERGGEARAEGAIDCLRERWPKLATRRDSTRSEKKKGEREMVKAGGRAGADGKKAGGEGSRDGPTSVRSTRTLSARTKLIGSARLDVCCCCCCSILVLHCTAQLLVPDYRRSQALTLSNRIESNRMTRASSEVKCC